LYIERRRRRLLSRRGEDGGTDDAAGDIDGDGRDDADDDGGDVYPEVGRNVAPLDDLICTRISGGITNALYRIDGMRISMSAHRRRCDDDDNDDEDDDEDDEDDDDGPDDIVDCDSVLVRIFGAEGMIDRDVETSTYSALCDAGIAYRHLGRFGNGRVEGWLVNYVPLSPDDLSNVDISLGIAREMANMHVNFVLPPGELRKLHYGTDESVPKVGLWDQLVDWMDKVTGCDEFRTLADTERVRALNLDEIDVEVRKYVDALGKDGGKIVFR
jgi:ethanolamine kinase